MMATIDLDSFRLPFISINAGDASYRVRPVTPEGLLKRRELFDLLQAEEASPAPDVNMLRDIWVQIIQNECPDLPERALFDLQPVYMLALWQRIMEAEQEHLASVRTGTEKKTTDESELRQ